LWNRTYLGISSNFLLFLTDLGGYYGNFISLFLNAKHANKDLLKNTNTIYNSRFYGGGDFCLGGDFGETNEYNAFITRYNKHVLFGECWGCQGKWEKLHLSIMTHIRRDVFARK
jgi:hypothetical protein